MEKKQNTSWEPVKGWYQSLVGKEGHYYHQKVILPGVKRLMELDNKKQHSVLDLACGTGILASYLPNDLPYLGIDISPGLIQEAKKADKNPLHNYMKADASKSLQLEGQFSIATVILAIQNMEHPLNVFKNAFRFLQNEGVLILVLNHPCFRIPRQSSWGIDKPNKIQYRRVDRYMSSMKVPIHTNPSKREKSTETFSFHHSLSSYSKWLKESGFTIELIEEWVSDKLSEGGAAAMENRAREEFPLFMAIKAKKSLNQFK